MGEETINEPLVLKPYIKCCHFLLYCKCNSSPSKPAIPLIYSLWSWTKLLLHKWGSEGTEIIFSNTSCFRTQNCTFSYTKIAGRDASDLSAQKYWYKPKHNFKSVTNETPHRHKAPDNLCGLCWTCSSMSMSLSCWNAQSWIQPSRSGLTSDELREWNSSLHLLATPLLNQTRMYLVFPVTEVHCDQLLVHPHLSLNHRVSFSSLLREGQQIWQQH